MKTFITLFGMNQQTLTRDLYWLLQFALLNYLHVLKGAGEI